MSNQYSPEIKDAAKSMWLRKCSAKDIAIKLSLNNPRVVYQWAEKGCWDDLTQHETPEQVAAIRLIALINKEKKTDADYKEIIQLGNLQDKLANIDIKKAKALRSNTTRSRSGDAKKGKGKAVRNDIGSISHDELDKIRTELFYGYQHRWYDNKHQRTRFILKSRQIGATYYFAWEAFEDAIKTGDNQVFLSASRAQAEVFKAYIMRFASEYFDVELKGGDVIILSNGAELRFVSTSATTAQGYHGHLYVDEVFWIPNFEKLNKVASAIASQKRWRKTYFSTPSVKSHGAYPMWSGERFNENRKEQVKFDLTHDSLVDGLVGPDKNWRNVVTIHDAQEQGCDLFDIDALKDEYTKFEFDNLFLCRFLEAGQSVFKLNDLLNCAIDSNVIYVDFDAKKIRPFGNKPVWVGYDPARTGDQSCVVVISPPDKANGKFRILEKIKLSGSYPHQAARIKDLTERYNVQFMAIDRTGQGVGVFDLVEAFYPRVTAIDYTLDAKSTLVLKAIAVVESQRIQWDAEHTDIPQAFLQVHQSTTRNDHITYVADRKSATGHADVAFAIMHGISNEPLNTQGRKASLAFGK